MPGHSRLLFHFLLAALMAVAVVACGGGGGGGGGGDSISDGASSLPASNLGSTGSVGVTLTDHPSDYFDKVVAIITRAELIGDPGRFTLFQGTKRFDLLRLRDESVPLTFRPPDLAACF